MKGKPKEEPRKKLLLKAGEIERMRELPLSHPLNPKSGMLLRPLADTVGLSRLGVHLVRLKQGRESNMVHAHHYEEEFFYILSGRGVALIDGKKHAVGPGDFMAFPTPSVSHLLANPYEEDLLYLVGGERKAFEIGEFPTIGKWLIRDGHKVYLVDRDALEEIDWRKGVKKKKAQRAAAAGGSGSCPT